MKRLSLILLGAFALVAVGAMSQAQIERLSLESMIQKTDDTIIGEIVAKEVIRIDDAKDGPELYYTHLTLRGESLETGQLVDVVVTFPGGFINEEDGVWNSEAPSDEDTKIGNKVVAFYKHIENAGGGLECNFLYASHGGLYRTVNGPNGAIALGRGEGYAIAANTSVQDLATAIATIIEKENR